MLSSFWDMQRFVSRGIRYIQVGVHFPHHSFINNYLMVRVNPMAQYMYSSVWLDNNIMQHVHADKNLSHATQLEHGIRDIGKKEGVLGMFSKGLITRSSASKDAVIAALSSLNYSHDQVRF